MLTSDRPLGDQEIRLPGPAAQVEAVPEEDSVLQLLTRAGFEQVTIVLRGEWPCFRVGPCELRETRIEAEKGSGEQAESDGQRGREAE
jgi:hypothetical protein